MSVSSDFAQVPVPEVGWQDVIGEFHEESRPYLVASKPKTMPVIDWITLLGSRKPKALPGDLFVRFSRLAPASPDTDVEVVKQGILEFAREFGALGVTRTTRTASLKTRVVSRKHPRLMFKIGKPRTALLKTRAASRKRPRPMFKIGKPRTAAIGGQVGESLEDWLYEVYDLYYALKVWRACESWEEEETDTTTLESLIHWVTPPTGQSNLKSNRFEEAHPVVFFASHAFEQLSELKVLEPHLSLQLIAERDVDNQLRGAGGVAVNFERDDYRTVARLFLQQEIKRHLNGVDTRRIMFLGDAKLDKPGPQVQLDVIWNQDQKRPKTVLRARTLLGALWMQLQEAIERRYTLVSCQRCGRWVMAAPPRGHPRKHCSNSCRVSASQEKTGVRKSKQPKLQIGKLT